MECKVFRLSLIILSTFCSFHSVLLEKAPVHPPPPLDQFKFQSGPSKAHHGDFIRKAMEIILKKGVFEESSQLQRIPHFDPAELETRFNFSLSNEPISNQDVLKVLEDLFEISPRPAHKFRMGKRIAGLDPLALAGDWMASTMSNLVVTYLVAPMYTLMEIKMTEYLSSQIGWTETGDMVPTSGAGAANSMAMAMATHHVDHTTRDIGLYHITKRLVILVSRHASISWKTAAIYNSIGTDNVVEIDVDEEGRMNPLALLRRLDSNMKEREIPVMIVATAGTPILGVIDPIEEIGSICAKRGIWFHVDAEKAGGYLFTSEQTRKTKLPGIERADSVTVGMWLFAAPYTSTMIITKDPEAMQHTFGLHASYVFTGIDHYNTSYDRGDHTIQTSRRPEISKIWFAAARGEVNAHLMFKEMENVKYQFLKALEGREGFEGVQINSATPSTNQIPLLSFYYVPRGLRGKEKKYDFNSCMTVLAKKVKKTLLNAGLIELSLSYLPSKPETFHAFFTVSFTNNRFTVKDIPFVLDSIEKVAEESNSRTTDALQFPEQPTNHQASSLAFPNYPCKIVYTKFLKCIFNMTFEKGIFFSREERAFNLKQPEEIDVPNVFDFNLPKSSDNLFSKMYSSYQSIIDLSPHWAHPYFIYQLAAGLDPYTLVADFISPVLNTPMLTYSDSAAFMLMEKELINQMVKRVYKSNEGDGVITDGGSMANHLPIAMARFRSIGNDIKRNGMDALSGNKFIVFTSGDAHYSTKKGAIFQGIGQNHTIEVASNNIGQMCVDKLEAAVLKVKAEGNIPLMVVITTGTTIYGAIDPIDAIVDVCEKYKMWCHVDGMFGGLAVMSDKHIGKFKGIERTDSWGADLHKLMGSTMVCTVFITRWPNYMKQVFGLDDMSQEEPYEGYDRLNLIGRHSQMDKRNNIFKFWLLWKAKGRKGLEAHVDKIMHNKDYLISEIRKRKQQGFELVIDDFDLTNICFRFMPSDLNPMVTPGVDTKSKEWKTAMDKVAFLIEKEFVGNGIMCFVSQHRTQANGQNTVKFIKFVMMGSALTEPDIRFLLDSVAYYGNQIKPESRTPVNFPPDFAERNSFDPFGNLPKYIRLD